jgi:tetratricopeptide (TPR) repeat protein
MRAAAACVLAALAAVAVYWKTLDNGFTWDDHIHIEAAPFVKDAHNARVLLTAGFWTSRTPVEGSARPLMLASLLADRALWGEKPAGYHLTNLLLHAACAAALAWLAFLLTGSAALAALAGLLFALHPVQSEAVCEITFRADLLSALGVLLALAALRMAFARRSRAWAAAAAAAFALGLLGKETAVVFPVLALIMEVLFPTAPGAARARRTAAVLIATALAAYAAFRIPRGGYAATVPAQSPAQAAPLRVAPTAAAPAPPPQALHATTQFTESPPEWREAMRSPVARLLTMSGILDDYARLTLWPAGLQADRSAPTVSSWASPRPWAGWAVALALLAAAWAARAALPAAAFGLIWFLIALAPVSGALALPNLIAERYLYLAVAGAALAAAAALDAVSRRLKRPRAALAAAAAALLLPAAAATRRRVPYWKNDAALFGAPPATDSARLHYNLGLLAQNGGRLTEAEAEYRRASDMNPKSVEALVNLAVVEGLLGRKKEQLAFLRRAVVAAPSSPIAFEALGNALDAEGKKEEALAAYKMAVDADVHWPTALRSYAGALARAGRVDEALQSAGSAAALEPKSSSDRYALGRIAQEAGRLAAAAEAFREAVRLDPKNELAWENLGVSLHHSGDASAALVPLRRAVELSPGGAGERRNLGVALDDLRRGPEAEAALAEAVRLDPKYVDAWHALGVVRQKLGETSAAEEAYRRAVALAPKRVESLSNLAGLYETDGRLDEAQALLEKAMAADPRPAILNNLANIYRARNRFADAAHLYTLALEQNARYGDPPAAQATTRVNLALCWLALDRPALAESEARAALAAVPDDASAREILRRAEHAREAEGAPAAAPERK